MDAQFSIIGIDRLFKQISNDYNQRREIFGIPESLFFKPQVSDVFRIKRYNQVLETPFGVAAGPHSQLAQNIISAWLCGARYIELKTIQTLDELNVSKPCIDMQDEGYNCEWSQELKIHDSYHEYLKAWILIHVLKHMLKMDSSDGIGMIFNISVGYNLEGILKDNVQWFFKKMNDCSEEKETLIADLKPLYPQISELKIPTVISNNVTLSTMHGCPPDEIEKIALYLISEKKLHTTVKLNPTLLGAEQLRSILNNKLGFQTVVPDLAFEHDLKYSDAIKIIKNLQKAATENNVDFSVKTTNTLESENHKNVFPPNEKMMYMSGRALHPISINLAKKLQNDFNGTLDVTFSAGIDTFNINDVLNSGLKPITVCSDVLKPGGYGRLAQYVDALRSFKKVPDSLKCLNNYADEVLTNNAYKHDDFHEPNIKSYRELNFFDCIQAPCMDACATNQDIPSYMYAVSQGDFQQAYEVILKKNPFPNALGMVCNHECQTKCTRVNYDNNLLIREIKRFVAEYGNNENFLVPKNPIGKKVSIIGAGPSGLSCAYFLRLAGFDVDIYETNAIAGGMVANAIPAFRLKTNAYKQDIERIEKLGVRIFYNHPIDTSVFENIHKKSQYTYIAVGAQKFKKLNIENEESMGVYNPFDFLKKVKNHEHVRVGKYVIIVGGGNTAMDVARTAYRLIPSNGKVTVLYRRTLAEMPAEAEEIKALLDEGIEVMELTAPVSVISKDGMVTSIKCIKMKLGEPDKSGRPRPEKIEGSEFEISADLIIPALGQEPDINFMDKNLLKANPETNETMLSNVFIGGDALHNASTFIRAVGDGRKVAGEIIKREKIDFSFEPEKANRNMTYSDYIVKKSKRVKGIELSETAFENRKNFDVVINPLTKEQAVVEASRCLLCDDVCSVCVTVCPNRANYTYFAEAKEIPVFKISRNDSAYKVEPINTLQIQQKVQVLNIADFCNECGNCTTFCPTKGAPYKDKPKFYLTEQSFSHAEKGFLLKKEEQTLLFKNNEVLSSLKRTSDYFRFENDVIKVVISQSDYSFKQVEFKNATVNTFETSDLATMIALIDAAKNLY